MRRTALALTALMLIGLAPLGWVDECWARAGGGSSGGSRGSRSYSAPARPAPSQMSPQQRPAAPPPAATQAMPQPQRSGWGGMLGGLLVGGLIGSLLFGGMGHGMFGGIGLLEILIVGGLILFAISAMRRMAPAPAAPSGYASPGGYSSPAWRPDASSSASTATLEAPAAPPAPSDLDVGMRHVQQLDPNFDTAAFTETASDIFFKLQAAWTAREMSRVAPVLTPEMQGILQKDCDRMRAERKINRLESIAVRSVEVTEAWQERGQDYVTVRFLASLLDYTTDESGAQVLDGSQTDPVKFEEFWTFTRPVGPNPWKLSAIQQAS